MRTFVVEEPIVGPSDKESDDAKVIREFLTAVFAQVRHGRRVHIGIVGATGRSPVP